MITIKRWDTGDIIHSGNFKNIKECLEDGVAKNVNFHNAKLNYAKLNGAKLNHAKLNYAKLNGAELNYAKLNGAELNGAELHHAELNGAELNGAELHHAELNGAELNYAKLNGADLNGADLNSAELNGAIFDFSSWPLWCGSLNVLWSDRIFSQLLYHLLSGDHSELTIEFKNIVKKLKSNPECTKFSRLYRTDIPDLKG